MYDNKQIIFIKNVLLQSDTWLRQKKIEWKYQKLMLIAAEFLMEVSEANTVWIWFLKKMPAADCPG